MTRQRRSELTSSTWPELATDRPKNKYRPAAGALMEVQKRLLAVMPPVEASDEKADQAGESRQVGDRHDEGDGPVGDARRDQNVVEADGAQDGQHDKSEQSQQ